MVSWILACLNALDSDSVMNFPFSFEMNFGTNDRNL
jgi:hypothetical protein